MTESGNTVFNDRSPNQAAYMMPGSLTAEAAVIHILVELGQLAFTGNGKYACIGQSPGKSVKFAGINHGIADRIRFGGVALFFVRPPHTVFIDFPAGIFGIVNLEFVRNFSEEIPDFAGRSGTFKGCLHERRTVSERVIVQTCHGGSEQNFFQIAGFRERTVSDDSYAVIEGDCSERRPCECSAVDTVNTSVNGVFGNIGSSNGIEHEPAASITVQNTVFIGIVAFICFVHDVSLYTAAPVERIAFDVLYSRRDIYFLKGSAVMECSAVDPLHGLGKLHADCVVQIRKCAIAHINDAFGNFDCGDVACILLPGSFVFALPFKPGHFLCTVAVEIECTVGIDVPGHAVFKLAFAKVTDGFVDQFQRIFRVIFGIQNTFRELIPSGHILVCGNLEFSGHILPEIFLIAVEYIFTEMIRECAFKHSGSQ